MDPLTIATIAGPLLLKLFGGGGGNKTPQTSSPGGNGGSNSGLEQLLSQVPEYKQMLQLQTSQAQRQVPLHAALTQIALNFLPNAGFNALPGRPSVFPSNYAGAANVPSSVKPYNVGQNSIGPNARSGMNLAERRLV